MVILESRFYFFCQEWGVSLITKIGGVIKSLEEKINQGHLQIFCIDSLDLETFYNNYDHPGHRIYRHCQYEIYILEEVFPLMHQINHNPNLISVGCSLGAYHAVNIALRHLAKFCKVVGMSGRYDLTFSKVYFNDLMQGYHDENVYFNMPTQYLKDIDYPTYLEQIDNMDIVLVIGKEDLFLENNYQLKEILDSKQISYQFYEWDGKAHKARYWRKIVPLYI